MAKKSFNTFVIVHSSDGLIPHESLSPGAAVSGQTPEETYGSLPAEGEQASSWFNVFIMVCGCECV